MSEQNNKESIKSADNKEHLLFHKRKVEHKSNARSATDDEDLESAPSLKASSNPPLPELHRDKRKQGIKPFGLMESKGGGPFIEKEVRQHDNILLKQRNNLLSSENLKLKTRLAVLQKQNQRLQKTINSQNSQVKPGAISFNNRERIKAGDSTLRAIMRGLRKEIEDLKKQNMNIKTTVKFTSLQQLEAERDHLAEETIRLRLTLDEEHSRRTSLRQNVQGVSTLENKLQLYTQKNAQLTRELREAQEKGKKVEQLSAKLQRTIENDKKNTKALHNALMQLKQKEAEVQEFRSQMRTANSIPSSGMVQNTRPKQNKMELRRPSIQKNKPKGYVPQPKPSHQGEGSQCQKCTKLEHQNSVLVEKIKKLEGELEKGGELPKGPINEVAQNEVEELKRFMSLRFKAHRLSYEQSEKYLINCQGEMDEAEMSKQISVRELMESLFVEPFCIVSHRYIEIMLAKLVYKDSPFPIAIQEEQQVKKKIIVEAYKELMPKYQILNQQKEEQMFIQVAELVTTYYQQILAALTAKRNGEGTIAEPDFQQFFKQIQLEQEYIDFIITQIILESIDMNHLNFFAMFEIFYMPQMNTSEEAGGATNKKKFEVETEKIVEEEDQEYEDSKSHLESRMKTLEHKEKEEDNKLEEGAQQEQEYGWEEQSPKKQGKAEEKLGESDQKVNKETKPQTGNHEEEEYIEEFEDKEAIEEIL